jgi:hypothetical protein
LLESKVRVRGVGGAWGRGLERKEEGGGGS